MQSTFLSDTAGCSHLLRKDAGEYHGKMGKTLPLLISGKSAETDHCE